MNDPNQKLIKRSILSNQIIGALLVFAYCLVYGVKAQEIMSGLKLVFFLSSLVFALSVIYVRDPEMQKAKIKKTILYNQFFGYSLIVVYLLIFGISGICLLEGFQLLFFISSYAFAMSLFYIRDPDRLKKAETTASATLTSSPFQERNPCFINSKDLSWLVREINNPLSTIVGFSELMLSKNYTEHEKEYMIRNIYEQSVSISNSINKVASLIQDSPAKPKVIHEVVDLLADKNFK